MVGTTIGATNVAQAGLKRILQAAGITVSNTAVTENVGSLPGLGSTTAAVIFLDNSGDMLWDHGRAVNASLAVSTTTSAYLDSSKVNLRQYMRSGGGFVAIHNAVGAVPNWFWYRVCSAMRASTTPPQPNRVRCRSRRPTPPPPPSVLREHVSPLPTASTPSRPSRLGVKFLATVEHEYLWPPRGPFIQATAPFTRLPGVNTTTAAVPG